MAKIKDYGGIYFDQNEISKRDLLLYSNYYYSLNFNVTCITDEKNQFNKDDKNLKKTPNHPWLYLIKNRQDINILKSYDWHKAIGMGVVLGHKNLRALDIDGCIDLRFIQKLLKSLNLPLDYEWVVESGSGKGFHILFYSNDHNFSYHLNPNTVFLSNTINNKIFDKIELRWIGHLVLPPTNSHAYRFVFKDIPENSPQFVDEFNVSRIIESNCLTTFEKSFNSDGGYTYKLDNIQVLGGDFIDTSSITLNLIEDYKNVEYPTSKNYIVFDTETNGLPLDYNGDLDDWGNWPRLIQLAYAIFDEDGKLLFKRNFYVSPTDFEVDSDILALTNIDINNLINYGHPVQIVLKQFIYDLHNINLMVGHNLSYDLKIIISECNRLDIANPFKNKKNICTMKFSEKVNSINYSLGGKYPKLQELHEILFNKKFNNAHDAMQDVLATNECFLELLKLHKTQG